MDLNVFVLEVLHIVHSEPITMKDITYPKVWRP